MYRVLLATHGLLLLMASTPVWADDAANAPRLNPRYGIQVDLKRYPQNDPQTAIRSVIAATETGDIKYLLAHLISPEQVDAKLNGRREMLDRLAATSTPSSSKELVEALRAQLADGTWTIRRDRAWSQAKGVPDLSLERIGGRWFMHNTTVERPERP